MSSGHLFFIFLTIALALAFDFSNGFHDAANSITTIVSTRVLKPQYAVIWAAFFNFIAFLIFKLTVATTIGTGLVDPSIIDTTLVFAALLGAVVWNIITWFFGLPSSSSHALVGGLLGAAFIKSGTHYFVFAGVFKVILAIMISPLLAYFVASTIMFIILRVLFYYPRNRVERVFRTLQFFTAALFSLGHGGNDAQKTMGIIAVLLFSNHLLSGSFYVPLWITIACQSFMALGTLLGGWRIVKTMGMKITKLTPAYGCCAELSASLTLFIATNLGIPVSTTHTISGAIFGVGSMRQDFQTRWGIVFKIVLSWVITLPAAGCVAALIWRLLQV